MFLNGKMNLPAYQELTKYSLVCKVSCNAREVQETNKQTKPPQHTTVTNDVVILLQDIGTYMHFITGT